MSSPIAVETPRDRRRLRTRRELAVAAVRLFEERGFAATTVEEIAAEADYSASTFFRFFARKEDAVFFDMPDRIEALRAGLPPHSSWAVVRAAMLEHARNWEQDDAGFAAARVRLYHREPAITARYLEYCQQYEDWLSELVAAHRDTDPRTDVTSRLVAGCIVAALRGAFQVQEGADAATHARSVVASLEQAFDALEAGPLRALD